MGLRSWFNRTILNKEEVTVRARTTSGAFKADDPTTKDKNEAYVTTYKKKTITTAKKKKKKKKKR